MKMSACSLQALRALHRDDRHRLAEGNVGRFEQATAIVAGWRDKLFRQVFINVGGLVALAAFEASDEAIGAVELDEFFFGSSGEFVQSVDILRDQTEQLTAPFKIADRFMSDIGFDGFEKLIGRFFELPMLHARRFAGEKILKQHGLILRPDAAWTAEIGHAGFGADTRAGEKDDGAGMPQARRQIPRGPSSVLRFFRASYWFLCRVCGFGRLRGLCRWVSPGAGGAAAEVVMSTTLTSKTRVFSGHRMVHVHHDRLLFNFVNRIGMTPPSGLFAARTAPTLNHLTGIFSLGTS